MKYFEFVGERSGNSFLIAASSKDAAMDKLKSWVESGECEDGRYSGAIDRRTRNGKETFEYLSDRGMVY